MPTKSLGVVSCVLRRFALLMIAHLLYRDCVVEGHQGEPPRGKLVRYQAAHKPYLRNSVAIPVIDVALHRVVHAP
jgi:hypothetical protein